MASLQECFGGGGGRLFHVDGPIQWPQAWILGGTFSRVPSGASAVFGQAQQMRTPDLRNISVFIKNVSQEVLRLLLSYKLTPEPKCDLY